MCSNYLRHAGRLVLLIVNLGIVAIFGVLFVEACILIGKNHPIHDNHLTNLCIAALVSSCIAIANCIVLGCVCGAWKQRKGALRAYAYILFIIVALNVIIAVIGFTVAFLFEEHITRAVYQLFWGYPKDDAQRATVDNLQKQYKCCGLEGTTDWTDPLPDSCCLAVPCKKEKIFKKGCPDAIAEVYKFHKIRISAIAAATIAFTCLGGMVALCIIDLLRKQPRAPAGAIAPEAAPDTAPVDAKKSKK